MAADNVKHLTIKKGKSVHPSRNIEKTINDVKDKTAEFVEWLRLRDRVACLLSDTHDLISSTTNASKAKNNKISNLIDADIKRLLSQLESIYNSLGAKESIVASDCFISWQEVLFSQNKDIVRFMLSDEIQRLNISESMLEQAYIRVIEKNPYENMVDDTGFMGLADYFIDSLKSELLELKSQEQ